MKTAEEYLNQYHDSKWFLHDLIRAILSDAQAEIDALKASQLQPLPEEMPEEFVTMCRTTPFWEDKWQWIVQRYGTPWWAKLKEGDEISWLGRIKTFKRNRLEMSDGCIHLIDDCRPYTGPTADEIIAEIGQEKYEVLKKHIKEGRR